MMRISSLIESCTHVGHTAMKNLAQMTRDKNCLDTISHHHLLMIRQAIKNISNLSIWRSPKQN